MVGKNTIIINHDEMIRAMNVYLKDCIVDRSLNFNAVGKVLSVKQTPTRALKDKPRRFILEIEGNIHTSSH